ncbi:MAG: uroporphyrinogen-III synthase [Proteobacteria bacterium]|nr:uroporphyrinogen-III synthase [Pseudomonadota bacterium]
MDSQPLKGRVIAIPETREVAIFAAMLERRGATVVRCPMVAILDAPNPAPILDWSRNFSRGACDDLILLTGEGLHRILSCIEHHEPGLKDAFVQALGPVRKITRGPKPARALRELGFKTDIAAEVPTTEGVINSLRSLDLKGRRIGLQLYGTEPNRPLVDFLQHAGATVSVVAPYVYADAADDQAVLNLLARLEAREIDAVAFTSTPQVERLFSIAPVERVTQALSNTVVAAVGPVVSETLRKRGIQARVMPDESFFLKPLTSELEDALAARG